MRQRVIARIISFGVALGAGQGMAQSWPDGLQDAVDFGGTIFHLETQVPGLVVGAVLDGEIAVQGFGETRRGNGIVPNGDTILRIGSITKVFTGQILAEAVARHEVAFTDPVAPLLPPILSEPASQRQPIHLVDLVTHSGGLPREVPRQPGPADDPYATITPEAFADWLREHPLQYQPGTAVSYSNFGFDLLSAALATAGDAPYPQLLNARITGPLDMADTSFAVAEENKDRLMSGHAPDGSPMQAVPSGDVITGSGGLHSTARDLLRWMVWHLSDDQEGAEARFLDHAVYLRRDGKNPVVAMDESGRMDGMGLGWVAMEATGEHPFILQKAGALEGQMSYIAFAPEHGAAVFVSINQFDFGAAYEMADFANDLLAQLSGF
ncbi:D-alanyl-D-alanine-carboxypeptidase/endopeptidase AmpH [Paracoccus sp. Z330]|uniref:D-alanyl-D-alanine-carboxypeptidase/endopeptidase AmpH n=1 Tax=Paracoccus onchidii TaxID=3017813 RepID=A0ABT4ZJG8_9RHOB|nr:D-alanyl-D-alanine-carboxypeptidase/endopeptidase AmpH [Paracoccus onchidii]MDB6179207.1 D-alanyl-D-alanine-carboxypeptidase/endopeptidase AmpH [Paracoccus onchidii]